MPTLRLASGRFQTLRQVGEGGAGVVFEGRDLTTNSPVAIKLLHSGNELAQERFDTEIAVLAELPHPAIVRYIAHGLADDGRSYLVMEWLAGKTVDEHRSGQWTVTEVLTLARRVVSGLAFAAQRGVSHRDIKPANLFLVADDVGNAKILDFGLARRSSDPQRASTGSVVGTPLFMSPEQARGDDLLDARTDVFSLGSVLYACLCGRPPFLAQQSAAIMDMICYDEPMPIEERAPHVPVRLRTLVQAMMRKDPAERPTWRAIAEELSEIAEQHVELSVEGMSQDPAAKRKTLYPGSSASHRRVRVDYRILAAVFVSIPEGRSAELEAVLSDVAAQHDARIQQLAGGAACMLLAKQQLDTSEQAVVAARCALSLQRALESGGNGGNGGLGGHGGPAGNGPGRAAIVLCTGRAALGGGQPFGELIDRAASLLAGAPPNAVHVDPPSAALLEARFELGGLELEGTRRTLVRERSGAAAARTLLGQTSPFVGREGELAQLQQVFDDCVRTHHARPVLVTGPAGGGKSRLLQALLDQLRAARRSFTLLAGRGDPMRGGTQFGILSFALQAWADIASSDDLGLKRTKLSVQVSKLVPNGRAALLAHFLGEMIGVPFPGDASPQLRAARLDPQLMADLMLESWLAFCDALGERGPTLFCIEDVHWSDPASVRFIDAALRSSRDRAFMVLALARPEIAEVLPQLWAERDLLQVQLPKLDARASTQLLEQLSGAPIEPSLRAALIERADGNPFFLEELVRGLATRPRDRSLPETVLAVVQARLADLGEGPKLMIHAASIFGQSFRLDAIRALLEQETDGQIEFDDALAQLWERELVLPAGTLRSQEFVFRQALVREAAYLLQPDEERELGHRLAAEWLEQAGENPAIVADHYERGGERASAGQCWARAAEQAFEVGSADDTLRFGARAIACGLRDGAFGKLAVVLAEARSYVADDIEAATLAERARASLAPGSADWWHATHVAAILQLRSGDPGIDALAQQMIEHFAPDNPLPQQAIAIVYTASDCLRVMRDDVAERLLALLPKRLPESLAGRPEGCLAAARARKAYRTGNLSEALRFGRDAISVLREAGAQRDVCDTLNLCGYFLHELGAYAQAEPLLLEATQLGNRIGSRIDVHYSQLNLGSSYLRLGRYDEAERALLAALEGFQKLAIIGFQGEALGHLAEAQRARADLDRARQTAERALQLDSLDAAPTALALARLAAIDLSLGLTADALEHANAAHALVREHNLSEFVGLIAVSHVESLQAAALHEPAREALAEAVRWLEEQAAKIDDAALRRSFLEQVPEHARLLGLAAAA